MIFLVKAVIAVLNFIFLCMKVLPVKNKITYISRQSNSKSEDMTLLEIAIKDIAPEIRQVFLCKKLDGGIMNKAWYCFHILSQMYHIATSKAVILDSYCISISALNQRESLLVIQMWHALGSLKKFGFSIVGSGEGRDQSVAEAFSMHRNYTYILTSGKACKMHFAEAFGYHEDSIKVMSLPRVDKLRDENVRRETVERIHIEYPEFAGKNVVVYAPTFRKDKDISQEISRLSRCFDKEEYAFVLKKHPLMETHEIDGIVDDKFTTIEMMYAADYVICDYSAVIFEAAVMGKPLFFYAFDYDSYGVDRDFYIDYKNEMPGKISSDPEEIAEAIRLDDYNKKEIIAFGRKYVEQQENCSGKLAEFVVGKMY